MEPCQRLTIAFVFLRDWRALFEVWMRGSGELSGKCGHYKGKRGQIETRDIHLGQEKCGGKGKNVEAYSFWNLDLFCVRIGPTFPIVRRAPLYL